MCILFNDVFRDIKTRRSAKCRRVNSKFRIRHLSPHQEVILESVVRVMKKSANTAYRCITYQLEQFANRK